ncbi:MAG: sirohydrochlorin chelatase [Cellulosilyticaceae bacterium]
MKAILILAHGSREKQTEQTLAQVIQMVKEKSGVEFIEHAFLQFSERNLEAGLDALIEKGADEITIVPYFLFEGVHIQEDIPSEIQMFTQKHPGITVHFSKTLGADERLADILVDRIKDAI